LRLADWAVRLLFAASVLAALLILTRSVLVVALAGKHTRRCVNSLGALGTSDPAYPTLPAASVVVPAFNETVGIEVALRSLADSDYPDFEIIVVDDGSTDETAEVGARLHLAPVRLLCQPNMGKAAALNTGIAHARHDLIVMVDADTVFEPTTLRKLLQAFRDPAVGAVSGNAKVGNRGSLLGRWQHIEYVSGFNLDRRAYDVLRCMPTVPGAVGAFRRRALEDVGGVSGDTLAEDTDLTMAVLRAGWHAVYVEDARAWTEAPSTLRGLWRQRYRWGYGTLQAMWKHRQALREAGNLGRVALPYLLLFQVLLPLLAPVVDVLAVYGLAFADPAPIIGYWAGFNALQTALTWYAFRLDRESPRVLWAAFLAQFAYRQLLYLVAIASVNAAAAGARLQWQKLERKGDIAVPTSP
ncbi:MAG: glycosyltransferase family 2 protein, partial [Actinomycetota bacterium]|nr:glycosyltransferase family 2 protein [Actinomycetota bacterium]